MKPLQTRNIDWHTYIIYLCDVTFLEMGHSRGKWRLDESSSQGRLNTESRINANEFTSFLSLGTFFVVHSKREVKIRFVRHIHINSQRNGRTRDCYRNLTECFRNYNFFVNCIGETLCANVSMSFVIIMEKLFLALPLSFTIGFFLNVARISNSFTPFTYMSHAQLIRVRNAFQGHECPIGNDENFIRYWVLR